MTELGQVTLSQGGAWLLALFGVILTIDKVVDVIKKIRNPQKDTAQTIANHGQMLDKDKRRLDYHDEVLDLLLKSQLTYFNHVLSGNDVENIRKRRDEMQAFLAEHHPT